MDITAIIFDIATIIISIVLCIKYFKHLTENSRFIIYFIFLLFYVFPLLLDYIYMMPSYTFTWYIRGFEVSHNDTLTRSIYDVGIIFAQYVLLNYKKKEDNYDLSQSSHNDDGILRFGNDRLRPVLIFFMLLPALIVLVCPTSKGVLYTFQWRENNLYEYDKYMMFVDNLSYVSICSTIMILLDKKSGISLRLLALVFSYVNICVQGKRSILFFAFLVAIIVIIPGLRDKTVNLRIRRRKMLSLIVVALLVVVIMIIVSINVHTASRGSTNAISVLYTSLRIDFFRDDRVRLAIYELFHGDEMSMLDYPMQSILSIPSRFFPLNYILISLGVYPTTYTAHLSACAEMVSFTESFSNMTPSMYAELVSNMHLFGLIVMPFICVWFARITNRMKYPLNVLMLVVFVSLQMYDFAYMAYLVEFAIVLVIIKKSRIRFLLKKRWK